MKFDECEDCLQLMGESLRTSAMKGPWAMSLDVPTKPPRERNIRGLAFIGKYTGGWHGSNRAVRWYARDYDFALESNARMSGYRLWIKGEPVAKTFRFESTAIAHALKNL